MAGQHSFVKQLLYPSTFSIVYGWEIKQVITSTKIFQASYDVVGRQNLYIL